MDILLVIAELRIPSAKAKKKKEYLVYCSRASHGSVNFYESTLRAFWAPKHHETVITYCFK